ncbi:DUF1212-domain-containing protein [Lentinus brumalis]|uniref:DUF1212-domain-containing protein n=1 Tax=Lentinus brumalis TaxID=2498619 RepID=A0A371D1D4_9APHY|nr:DUF1212-domain-containing protein [Polyporus brumalis]
MNSTNSEPAPADTRPPGGTRRSGQKTPRRVQWQFDEPSQALSPRALDEHGLDPEAFQTLTHALERHRSSSLDHDPSIPLVITAPTAVSPAQSLPPSPEISPMHEVPGEVFIDRHETAGLPGRDVEKYAQEQAEKVMRAHKYNFLRLNGKHRRTPSQPKTEPRADDTQPVKKGTNAFRNFFREFTSGGDVEKSADVRTEHKERRSTGVLGTLLSIYEPTSAMQSGVTTPARSSFDESRPASPYSGSLSASSSAAMMPPPPVPHHAKPGNVYHPGATDTSSTSLRPPNHPWTRAPMFGDSRPPKSKSGAGVFGPLIAGTGSIAGVGAPPAVTVAPDLKRPGYHLSRYSLESNMPKAKAREKSLSRPQSSYFSSRPTSPTVTQPPSPSEETISPQSPASVPVTPAATPGQPMRVRRGWTGSVTSLPKLDLRRWSSAATPSTMPSTPATEIGTDEYESGMDEKKKDKRRKRKKAEIWITRHVAEIVCRQEFILKFTRAMMMFGGPSHRLISQIQATAKVLDLELSCMYLPDVTIISFEDQSTSTSNIKFIRQGSALDIGKLQEAHKLHWKVIHDEISVKDASVELDELMRRKPYYNNWYLVFFGGACSASICSVSFNGSFIDSLMSFPLGCLLILIQIFASRNELYSNVFEITVATIFSFIAAALSSASYFCYSAIASASVVLILPGFIVLMGSLELSSRNIVSGAVRVCFSCIYSLFLGFGLAIGATAYSKLTNRSLAGSDDLSCGLSHDPNGPWWQRTPPLWWAFLTVPAYSLFLSLRNHAPWRRRELYLLVAISCIGWVTNHFTGTRFRNQSDISAAVGALAVGFVANMYGRFFNGNAFVVMITGILFQLPSGLANGGLFTFVSQTESGSSTNESYLSGFQTALQLISVSIGLTVGLGISLVLVHPIPSRRRAAGLFSL